ncbi:hypothetical protein T03_9094 [Trichinella britovi]|uniref:Uncharacterized protein n=1 Tax=Trichinella britovi TaxID=45882 RepID=A0A0V1AK64_TRIBR|nr:hypothetical protein T03_9094 [Trichinella britovi]
MDNSLLDPGSKPFDIAQILFTPNNGNETMIIFWQKICNARGR